MDLVILPSKPSYIRNISKFGTSCISIFLDNPWYYGRLRKKIEIVLWLYECFIIIKYIYKRKWRLCELNSRAMMSLENGSAVVNRKVIFPTL
jgi:hypothetical protein